MLAKQAILLGFGLHGDQKSFAFAAHGHGDLLAATHHGGGFQVLHFEGGVGGQVTQQLGVGQFPLVADKSGFMGRHSDFGVFEHTGLNRGAAFDGLGGDPDHFADRVVGRGSGNLGAKTGFDLHHHKMLPDRLGATRPHALFVAIRLVKHNVLCTGVHFDAAVHGLDGDQAGFEFVGVHDKLLGTLLDGRPARVGDRHVLRDGLLPHRAKQGSGTTQGDQPGFLTCLKSSAQHLQDGLQECESFDVFGVSLIPDAISMPTNFQLAERHMNFNIDSKALVKTDFSTPNTSLMTAKQTVEANIARIGFAQTLAQLQARNSVNSSTILNPQVPSVAVKEGDTLTGIVKNQMQALGKPVSNHQAARLVQDIARHNGLANPDRIYPGQRLNLAALSSPQLASGPTAAAVQAAPTPNALSVLRQTPPQFNQHHPVLQKTLDRAVAKGFIPAEDRQKVFDKILTMSRTYQFAPDDFARLTLMESDGMNPKATNSRCHGIIQFCDGPDRGAASAGFGSNPKAILGHSVFEQLDMVSKYFDETGLRNGGPTRLDDLYLTVLTPAARREKAPDASLNIAGTQAQYLYVNRDKTAPITRNSIMQGLYQNALERLGKHESSLLAQNTPAAASSLPTPANAMSRAQALRIGAYLNQDYVR